VRRMLQAIGHPVVSLIRTRVGPLTLGDLKPGQWRRLTQAEVGQLRSAAEKGAASRTGGGDSRQREPAQRDRR
jgi:23S rRNA pseudouridine2605 synthase